MRLVRAAPVSRLVTPQSGEYVDVGMLQGFYNSVATFLTSANTLFAWPFFLDQQMVISELHLDVSTAEAGKSIRLGIYSDLNGRPATLLADSGSLSAATTGDKFGSIPGNLVLNPGTYWAALNTDGTTVQVISIQGAGRVVLPLPRTTVASGSISTGRSVASTFGALPATYPGGSGLVALSPAKIELKIA